MKNHWILMSMVGFLVSGLDANAEGETPMSEATPQQNVKYKKGKDVDFEQLLIQGQLKRPEISVVTGNESKGTDGLLRLRDNFQDLTQNDIGEELP